MSRRFTALKPQLNRIRAWAHEGSTDAWIAHQLDTTADAVRAFRQENGIERGGPAPLAPITPDSIVEAMLAEEEAAAAARAALEAGTPEPEEAPAPDAPPAAEKAPAPRRRTRKRAATSSADASKAVEGEAETTTGAEELAATAAAPAKKSRRSTRGGSSRSSSATLETQVEPLAAEGSEQASGEDEPGRSGTARKRGGRRRGRGRDRRLEARLLPGSVLLLDPAVTADPVFQEHWGDAGPLRVEISADALVLRRSAADAEPDRQAG